MAIRREGLQVEFTGDHAHRYPRHSLRRAVRFPAKMQSPLLRSCIGVDYLVRKPDVSQETVVVAEFELSHRPDHVRIWLVMKPGAHTAAKRDSLLGEWFCANEIGMDPRNLGEVLDEMLHELERTYERA